MMILGAAFAGTAIENSMLGAAHSAANPLTAQYGVVHGQAVGRMLPAVIRFNAQQEDARLCYEEYAHVMGLRSVDDLVHRIEDVLALANMDSSLAELGVARAMIPTLAADAAKQWTATFNPRAVEAADFESLYEDVFE
jgi:alcohol dehydrogenase